MELLKLSLKGVKGMVFPRPCPGCSRSLYDHEPHICNICLQKLPFTEMEYQPDNEMLRRFAGRVDLQMAVAMLRFYQGGLGQKLMHAIKYKGSRALAHAMGMTFGHRLVAAGVLRMDQVLVPVPLHPHKLMIRGYNQSAEIAKGIAESTCLSIDEKMLKRVENHISQTRNSREQRWENIHMDFTADSAVTRNKHILIVDDVCTTGATAEVCASALLFAGAASVGLLTLAVAGERYS